MKEQYIYEWLVGTCDYAVQSVLKFANHNIPKEIQHLYTKSTNQHRAIIYNLVCYKWNEDSTYGEVLTDLLIRFVKQHSLVNGNKRTAVLLIVLIYNQLEMNINLSNWEKWITLLNKIAISDEKDIQKEVEEFLKANTYIIYFGKKYDKGMFVNLNALFLSNKKRRDYCDDDKYRENFYRYYNVKKIDEEQLLSNQDLIKLLEKLSEM